MRRRLAFIVAVGVALVFVGCKPKAGGDCKPGQVACATKSQGLVCRAGSFSPVPCNSASCRAVGTDLVCDQSEGEQGAPCLSDMEYACSSDKSTGLQCVGGLFQRVVVCRGPRGCRLENKRIACDTSFAQEGDACGVEDSTACNAEKNGVVRCKVKQFEAYQKCRGARGCAADENGPNCDQTVAMPDDACPRNGLLACSADKGKELVCQGRRFTISRKCEKGCTPGSGGAAPLCK